MENLIIDYISQYGYIAILLLICIENIFPPIPSELVLGFGGMMTTKTSMSIVGVIIVATLGSFLGAVILYSIGRLLSYEKLIKLLENKYVKKLGFKQKDVDKAREWFMDHGSKTVFICRLVPVIRSLISIPAGSMKMSFVTFSLWTLWGTLLWNTLLVYAGSMLGNHWQDVSIYIKEYGILIAIVIVVGFLGYKVYLKKSRPSI